MRIKAILIDDEINNLDNLRGILNKYCPEVEVIGTAQNAEEGRSLILQHHPDLVFLDIQMPDRNGFELLKSLPRYEFEVIITTAYDQFGIQAVKFSAIDYLLKPIDLDELQTAVNKVISKKRRQAKNLQIENLLHYINGQKEEHRIALTTQKETRFVPTEQIIYCESINNYTSFHLSPPEKIMVSKAIYEFEEMLSNYGFIRCHQSYLVNKKHIKSLVKVDGSYLLMETGAKIPVSRSKKDALNKLLRRH